MKVIRIPESPAEIRSALNDGMDEQSVTGYFKGFVDEILHEIAIMSAVKSHPNIVSYEDHHLEEYPGEIRWDILIRMELLTPLDHYLQDKTRRSEASAGALPVSEVVRLGREIGSALAFCQRKNIIHRDIKPENIFISEAGQFKLGDFGVAKTAVSRSTGGSHKGTERYMAPEVFLNQPYGSSVDIYSLGLVMYRLLNGGRLPFLPPAPKPLSFGDYENAQIRRMQGVPIPPPAKADAALTSIILKACAFRSADRFRSAAELVEALVTYHPDGEPSAALAEPSVCLTEKEQDQSDRENRKTDGDTGRAADGHGHDTGREQTVGGWNNSTGSEGTIGGWKDGAEPEGTVGGWKDGAGPEGTVGGWKDGAESKGTVGGWKDGAGLKGTVGGHHTDGGQASSGNFDDESASGKPRKLLMAAGAGSLLLLILFFAVVVIPKIQNGQKESVKSTQAQAKEAGSETQEASKLQGEQQSQEDNRQETRQTGKPAETSAALAFENKLGKADLFSPGELIVGMDWGKDDSSFFTSGEETYGVDGAVVKALGELSGLNVLTYPATSQFVGTFGRNYDIAVAAISKDEPPEAIEEYAALSEPYYTEFYALLECQGAETGFSSLEEAAEAIMRRTGDPHAVIILPEDRIPERIKQMVEEKEGLYIYSDDHDIYDCLVLLKRGDVDAILLPFTESAGLEAAFPDQFCVSCVDESCRTDYCIAVGKEDSALLEAVNEVVPLLRERELFDREAYAAHLRENELLVMTATETFPSVDSDENVKKQWEPVIETVSSKADIGAWPGTLSYGGSLEQLEEELSSYGFAASLSDGSLDGELGYASIKIEDRGAGNRWFCFSFDYSGTTEGEEELKRLIPVDGEYFGGSLSDLLTAWGITPQLFYTVSPSLSMTWWEDDREEPSWSIRRDAIDGQRLNLSFSQDESTANGISVRADKDLSGEEKICEIWFSYQR